MSRRTGSAIAAATSSTPKSVTTLLRVWQGRGRALGGGALERVSELDDELAGVVAVEEHVDGDGQLLESLHHGLGGGELALGHPLGQLRDDLRCAIEVVEDDEALEVDALDQEVAEVARAERDGGSV